METANACKRLIQTVSQTSTTASSDEVTAEIIGKFLESKGFLRTVCGDDWHKVLEAIALAHKNNRGLFVTGCPGCGKTALLNALRENYKGVFLYCKEPTDIRTMRTIDFNDLKGIRNIFIDDVGCEEIIREYGNMIDAVGDFIQRLHNRFKGRVFISTNLSSKQFVEKYGARTFDRILEMCVCFKMNGDSKRKRIIV